nr:hypothetical protein [uncultured Acetatifactor sp.]
MGTMWYCPPLYTIMSLGYSGRRASSTESPSLSLVRMPSSTSVAACCLASVTWASTSSGESPTEPESTPTTFPSSSTTFPSASTLTMPLPSTTSPPEAAAASAIRSLIHTKREAAENITATIATRHTSMAATLRRTPLLIYLLPLSRSLRLIPSLIPILSCRNNPATIAAHPSIPIPCFP